MASSVASHLGIDLREYDARIRSFIPGYEQMLRVAADAVPRSARTIVDLGIGTGALARRCMETAPAARVIGIDADPAMAAIAAARLGPRVSVLTGSFLRTPMPRCDAVVASLSLHHVRTRPAKQAMYRTLRRALRRGGRLVVVDCLPATDSATRTQQFDDWRSHLLRRYSRRDTLALLRAWAREDVYVPLTDETVLMRTAGFRVDVLWRQGAFAVVLAT
jgi:ubiquinone/menaquinone biosynthesis C-methylase UbiE